MVAICTPVPGAELRPPRRRLSEVEQRLLECFDAAPADPSEELTPLHLAARDYAHSLRKLGLEPEQLVIALKALLCCHGGFRSSPSLLEQQLARVVSSSSTKYAQVLKWCIEAYYEQARQT
jgi:hypothetical protein